MGRTRETAPAADASARRRPRSRFAWATALGLLMVLVVANVFSWSRLSRTGGLLTGASAAEPGSDSSDTGPIRRPGSVDLEREYNLEHIAIPIDEIHTLLPRDAIPALTEPKTERATDAAWLSPDDRIIVITVADDVYMVPLRILDYHEIVNVTIGEEPVAVTYCPLCDSVTVFSRAIDPDGPEGPAEALTLEFGVSGALFNSNVLMYDRRDRALWSQLGMEAVSGPLVGTQLTLLPFRLRPWAEARERYPDASVVSRETGHARPYDRGSPYEAYFGDGSLLVPVPRAGEALPRKTLGIGILAGANAWFVPLDQIHGERRIPTSMGDVVLARTQAGADIRELPEGVHAAQTFYYAWSAFRPKTVIVSDE